MDIYLHQIGLRLQMCVLYVLIKAELLYLELEDAAVCVHI